MQRNRNVQQNEEQSICNKRKEFLKKFETAQRQNSLNNTMPRKKWNQIKIQQTKQKSNTQSSLSTNQQEVALNYVKHKQEFMNKHYKKQTKNEISSFQYLQVKNIYKQKIIKSISVNSQNSLVLIGYEHSIQFFILHSNFKKLYELQFKQYRENLYFMKRNRYVLSVTYFTILQIWKQVGTAWEIFSQLECTNGTIRCVDFNQNEDLIVYSSGWSIVIWKLELQKRNYQVFDIHQAEIKAISLSESGTTLVSCGDDWEIIIMEEQQNQWSVKQKIRKYLGGNRLCMINDNSFAFQPKQEDILEIYTRKSIDNLFNLKYTVQIPHNYFCIHSFPQKFIKEKNLLVSKKGEYLNLLKLSDNNQLEVALAIKFDNVYIFGTLTDDGNYMITYNEYRLQIRKYIQLF